MESACRDHGAVGREMRCLDSARFEGRINTLLLTLKQRGLDLETHCGHASCYLMWHLPVLNETLCDAAMHLTEHCPGAFTLSAIPSVDVDVVRSDSSVMEAAILLHWLLKHHHCIRRLVLGINALPIWCFPAVLGEALAANKGLVEVHAHPVDVTESRLKARECRVLAAALGKLSLGLESLDITPLIIDQDSAEAIARAVVQGNLRHLALWTQMTRKVAKKLFSTLSSSTSLLSLEIAGCEEFSKSNASVLAAALGRNKTVRKLSVKNLKKDAVGIILASLERSGSLKELHLHYSMERSNSTLWNGLQALRGNRGLSCVKLTSMRFGNSCAMVVADILRENKTLQELSLFCNSISNTGGRALAKALTQNCSLRRFDISDNLMSGGAVVQNFIDAMAVNHSLESVRLGDVEVPEEWVPKWPLAGNVHARLHVTWNTRGLESCAGWLRDHERFPRLDVGWTDDAASSGIVQWFSAACAISASLTELSVECPLEVHSASSAAVASFLEATVSLKKLVVYRLCVSTFVTHIITGLTLNKSVCDAEFHQILRNNRDVKALQTLFGGNRTLRRLMFSEYWLDDKAARLLARALKDNFVFLTFESEYFIEGGNLLPLLSVLNRNRSFLNRAVEYVQGTAVDSRAVQAFELLSACDSLLDAVSDATGKTREESRCLVLEAGRRRECTTDIPPPEPR